MDKIKRWLIETDAIVYIIVLFVSAIITGFECYYFESLIESILTAREDNAAFMVIIGLLICPGIVIGMPFYLRKHYKKTSV